MNDPIEILNRVKNLYAIITNKQLGNDADSVNIRVDIVRELEKSTRQEFKSTEDFHKKINDFLCRMTAAKNNAERFRQARESLGLTQKQLAEMLGLSLRRIKHWENGTRAISKRGLAWLNSALKSPNLGESQNSSYGER